MSEIPDGEDIWQWSRLEIRLNALRRSTIPRKQFIIIIITFSLGRWYLNIFYILFIFYYCQQVLSTLKVSSSLEPLNDTSVDVEGSFQLSFEAEFISPLFAHITFAKDTEAESPCFTQLLLLIPFFRSLWATKYNMDF